MHIVDTTLFFAPRSGGVRRYLLAKRRHLAAQSGVRHTLVVPGARDLEIEPGIISLRSTMIPFAGGYRFPLRRRSWANTICALRPDVLEIGDTFLPAWAGLDAADRLGIPAVAFAHSDLPRLLESRCGKLAGDVAAAYIAHLYGQFDLVLAPSRYVARDVRRLGIDRVVVQPLGVDGDIFHPGRRDPRIRAELGLARDTRLLIFAG